MTHLTSNVLKADEHGFMMLPNGLLLVREYPEGDYDTIDAANPNLDNLRHTLYEARECGLVEADASIFLLPDGRTINIDAQDDSADRSEDRLRLMENGF